MNIKYQLNKFITVRLEENNTFIYLNNKRFIQCKFLVINVPIEEINKLSNPNDIDHLIHEDGKLYESYPSDNLFFGEYDIKYRKVKDQIAPEEEFWAHCSNLQVWVEFNYDTRLLHSNLSFPLLKKLTELGDPIAKKVFKEEIAKRFRTGVGSVMKFLVLEGYLDQLNYEELEVLVRDLKKMDLSQCDLQIFPKWILKAKKTEHLYLNNNMICEIPNEIKSLKNIKVLDLSFNKLHTISESIGKLVNIENLILSRNQIVELPDCFTNLKSLKTLGLSDNNIITLPKSIGDLTSLENMNLSNNKLLEITNSIRNNTNLKKLDLSLNKLNRFPEKICNILTLEQLSLSNNDIVRIPNSISNLNNLKVLDLSENGIIEIPRYLGDLNSLKNLLLSGNKIEIIPDSLKNLLSLEFIHLDENNLLEFPKFLDKLPLLKEITIDKIQNNMLSNKLREELRKKKIKIFLIS